MKRLAAQMLGMLGSTAGQADPINVLFVGNSYTFGRVDPVLSYNAANVIDLTRPQGSRKTDYSGAPVTNVTGTNSYPVGTPVPSTYALLLAGLLGLGLRARRGARPC